MKEYDKLSEQNRHLREYGTLDGSPPLDFELISEAGSKLFKLDFKVEVKHNNLFCLPDIDGINNDWVMYELILRNLEASGKIDPRWIRLREAVNAHPEMFPLISNFESVMIEYLRQVDEHLPKEHKNNCRTLEEVIKKHGPKVQKAADELTRFYLKAA